MLCRKRFTVIDLFAGAGGLSYGFVHQAMHDDNK